MVKFLVISVSILILAISISACNDATSTSWSTNALPTSPATGSSQDREPVEVVSVQDTYESGQLINPAGPEIEITLKNIGDEPVTQLTATLELEKSYDFYFEVTGSKPLPSGKSVSKKQVLVGPGSGISSDETYSLKVSGTLQSGEIFSFTKKVRIGYSFEL